jgi:hypothetical protein
LPANQPGVQQFFAGSRHERLDGSVTKFFITNAIPFTVADSPELKDMIKAVGQQGKTYKPPAHTKLSTTLLDHCYDEVCAKAGPSVQSDAKKYGASLVADGWTSSAGSGFYVIVRVPAGSMFVKLIEAGPEEEDAEWIVGHLGRVIDEVGAENIDLVVMQCIGCKAVGSCWRPNTLLDKHGRLCTRP